MYLKEVHYVICMFSQQKLFQRQTKKQKGIHKASSILKSRIFVTKNLSRVPKLNGEKGRPYFALLFLIKSLYMTVGYSYLG